MFPVYFNTTSLMSIIFFIALLFSVSHGLCIFGYCNTCKYTRKDAVHCFSRHVDLNHDGMITVAEIDVAREKYINGFLKRIFLFIKWWGEIDTSTEKLIKDCSLNHGTVFTARDWMGTAKTCVATQFGMCLIKKVCDDADASATSFHQNSKGESTSLWSWL